MGSRPPRTVEAPDDLAHRSADQGTAPHTERLLAAERAAAAYWRNVAEERRTTAAATQRRPLVRAAIAVDRQSRPIQDRVAGSTSNLRRWLARTHLRLLAAGAKPRPAARRRHLHRQLELSERITPSSTRAMDVLVLDLGTATALGASDLDGRRGGAPPSASMPSAPISPQEVNRLVETCRPDAICILAPHASPSSSTWLRRLGQALTSEVAVAVPTLVHPERPGSRTPHDLLTRSRGLVVELIDGVPTPCSSGAGEAVDVAAEADDPWAATATCFLVSGEAWREVGGLVLGDDADASAIDLCIRVRSAGHRIRNLPDVLVTDWRPVDGVDDLATEIRPSTSTWRTIVAHHGPTLRRSASDPDEPCSITITTSVPSAKLSSRWGDWPYASAFARALRASGHRVTLQTLDRADDLAARSNDVQVVLRGLSPVDATVGQRHVLWVISHPESVTVEEYDRADLVLVASHRFAEHVTKLTSTPVEVFLQATDPGHFRLRPPRRLPSDQVLVVANSRSVRRRVVADAEASGIDFSVVGGGWEGLVDPSRLLAPRVDHTGLPELYASTGLVLNDHWDTMAHWGFVSNRILDVLACGTPVASDHLPELEEMFGDLVPTWRDPTELRAVVDSFRRDPAAAEERALTARDLVLQHHTFEHRAEELIGLLDRHGLLPRSEVR